MKFIYSLGLNLYYALIYLASIAGNEKAQQWISGRKNWKSQLAAYGTKKNKRYWVHCSSLGEFEQGRPLIEEIKKREPDSEIILTFFSPSGYEVRKKYPAANIVLYLPLDTPGNARHFIDLLNPDTVFFIKYEYWYHYLSRLHSKNIKVYVVSAIFRPGQSFFKWYGNFFKKMLGFITQFFVQDSVSGELLRDNGLNNFTVTGDTRFDRVIEVATKSVDIPLLKKFKSDHQLFIAGSTWPSDEVLIAKSMSALIATGVRIILVPHEVQEESIRDLEQTIQKNNSDLKVIRFSKTTEEKASMANVLIIDSVGLLSSAYQYAELAYVGGGFGKGIHNILEAAAYGIPVLFGPEYSKFKEAIDLIEKKGAFCVNTAADFSQVSTDLLRNETTRVVAGRIAREYVMENGGATSRILDAIQARKD